MADRKQPESESSSSKHGKSGSDAKATDDGAGSSGRSKQLILIGVITGGVLLGGAGGGLVLGPKINAARVAKASEPTAKGVAEKTEKEKVEKGKEPTGQKSKKQKERKHSSKEGKVEGSVLKIENLIVNPAGTEGSRFLMASVAFEFDDPKVEEMLRANDIAIRDQVISVLENQSMEMLTRPGARDSLRSQLAAVIAPYAEDAEMRVYLPQFVIQ